MIPPLFIGFRVKDKQHNIRLWFPLFIFGLILLPFILLAVVFMLFISIFISSRSRNRIWGIAYSVYIIMSQFKHLYIEVKHQESDVLIRFI
jgi:hypothetical protein